LGRARRPQPQRLPAKLREVRRRLGLTQQQLMELLAVGKSSLRVGHISEFESGKREPPLPLLLGYARLACVPLELLADGELELPERPHGPPVPASCRGGTSRTLAGL
jgi:transcriptional regulator with XRE-family HTH domain